MLTDEGRAAIEAGKQTIVELEARIDEILGTEGHESLRRLLSELLERA